MLRAATGRPATRLPAHEEGRPVLVGSSWSALPRGGRRTTGRLGLVLDRVACRIRPAHVARLNRRAPTALSRATFLGCRPSASTDRLTSATPVGIIGVVTDDWPEATSRRRTN